MGAEQSNPNRNEFRSRQQVNRALEQQRITYEQKYMEMLLEQAERDRLRENELKKQEEAKKLLEQQRKKQELLQKRKEQELEERKKQLLQEQELLRLQKEAISKLSSERAQSNVPNNATLYPNLANPGISNSSQINTMTTGNSSIRAYYNGHFLTPQNNLQNNTTLAPNITNLSKVTNNPITGNSGSPMPPTAYSNAIPSAPPRERSVSNTRGRNHLDGNCCKACGERFSMKIYQCPSGHSSCHVCKLRAVPCGVCRQPITDMRNITLEAYIAEQKVPCVNKNDGCKIMIKLADMDIHVKQCPFNIMKCVLPSAIGSCPWQGKATGMALHFDNFHPEQRTGNVNTEMTLPNICQNNRYMYLISLGHFNFLFHIQVSVEKHHIYMATQLMSTKISASKWIYDIHIYNKSQPRRKYQYIGVCTEASESIDDTFKDCSCAVVPIKYAMTFLDKGGLTYKIYIKRDDEQQDRRHRGQRRN